MSRESVAWVLFTPRSESACMSWFCVSMSLDAMISRMVFCLALFIPNPPNLRPPGLGGALRARFFRTA